MQRWHSILSITRTFGRSNIKGIGCNQQIFLQWYTHVHYGTVHWFLFNNQTWLWQNNFLAIQICMSYQGWAIASPHVYRFLGSRSIRWRIKSFASSEILSLYKLFAKFIMNSLNIQCMTARTLLLAWAPLDSRNEKTGSVATKILQHCKKRQRTLSVILWTLIPRSGIHVGKLSLILGKTYRSV